jgi:hypothetical protein
MTYGRVRTDRYLGCFTSAAVSHLAELVRGYFLTEKGPLIRPSATFSPRGEGIPGWLGRLPYATDLEASAAILGRASRHSSGGCAPEMAYLPLTMKNGTPWMPMR